MFPSEDTFIAATKLLGLLEKKIGESLYFLGCLVLSYVYSLFLEESLNIMKSTRGFYNNHLVQSPF